MIYIFLIISFLVFGTCPVSIGVDKTSINKTIHILVFLTLQISNVGSMFIKQCVQFHV